MKKIKEMLRRIGTAGLAVIMLTAQLPVTAFAEEIAQPQEIVVSDEVLPAEVQTVEKLEEGADEQKAQESDKKDADGDKEKKEQTASEKEERPAFSASKSIDGVRITVEADEGVFPKGATLSVKKVTLAQEKQAEKAVESERDEEKKVAASYTYDIKVLDKDGNELQPAVENGEDSSSRVKVSFKLDEVADENLEISVYHITESEDETAEKPENAGNSELTAEKLEVETDGNTAIAETDGFSLYTVEFTYDNKQYVLPGDSEVALSVILNTVGLTGEVSAVEGSDESLFSVKKCKTAEGGNTPEKDEDGKVIEDENGTWFVFTHQAFSTEEWMKVTIGGVMYEIMVTDSVSNNVSYIDADGTTKTASSVDVVDESLDDNAGSFQSSSGWLYVNNNVTLNGASNTGTVAINLILGDGKTLTLNNNAGLRFYSAPLTIYGQSSGTGKLSINGSNASYPMLYLGQNHSLTINSGTVEVTNNQNSYGTYAFGDKSLVMNGGSARFTARMGTAIYGDVTLNGGTFYASGKEGAVNGTVKVAEGKLYKDDADPCNYYFGTLSNAQKAAINGKTLSPEEGNIYAVAIGDVNRGTVTADKYTVAKEATGEARTVTLTLAPETGYSLKTLTVKDTSGNEVEVSGEGDTRTFTMPNGHVTVSAVFALPTVSTAYIDENGTEQTANAVALTGGGATTLDGGWYVVPENTTVSYTGKLEFNGNTRLILADGATLNCGTESGRINVKTIEVNNGGLTVYGQSDQTGRLNAYSNNANTIFSQNSAAFNGGTVTADSVKYKAIDTNGGVTIRRGTVNAVSSEDNTINADEGVTVAGGGLNVTAPDGKYAVKVWNSSYAVTLAGGTLSTTGGTGVVCYSNGSYVPATVKVADGMSYIDGANLYSGTLTDGQKAAIHGKTITPAYGVIAAEGIEHGTVSASPAAFAIKDFADADKTVTLTVTPDENYTIGIVSYNDGSDHTITPVNGVYSFTMPEQNVTVSATFIKSLNHSDITINGGAAIASQQYSGIALTPSITVRDGGTELQQGTDYTLSYRKVVDTQETSLSGPPMDAGSYKIVVTGKGNYGGERTVDFTITRRIVGVRAKDQSVEMNGSIATGTGQVETSVSLIAGQTLSSINLTLAEGKNTGSVGQYTSAIVPSSAVIKDASNTDVTANYDITYINGKLTVTKIKAKVTTAPEAKNDLKYTGSSQALLSTTGTADTSMEYALGEDTTTAPAAGWSGSLPAGNSAKEYFVWYRAKADDNHETGDAAVLTVKIEKADPRIATNPVAGEITYGKTLNDSVLNGGNVIANGSEVYGTFAWSDSSIAPAVSDSNQTEYTVTFTPEDTTNLNPTTCKVKLTVNKADIPESSISAPTAKTGLSYTGSPLALVKAGSVTGNIGTMWYAVTDSTAAAAPVFDGNAASADADKKWSTSVPSKTNAGTYYVWYKVVGDENHNDTAPQPLTVSISKATGKNGTTQTIEVQKGVGVETSVSILGVVGNNASLVGNPTVNTTSGSLQVNDFAVSSDKTFLTFKVTSTEGGEGTILATLDSDNYDGYQLTIPVVAQEKTTEVKLERPANVETSVQDVRVSGLDALTKSLDGTSVKVELDVKPENAPSDETVKNKIENAVVKIFSGVEGSAVTKEYLDISVKQTVDNAESTVAEVGSVVEIAVNYDLTGKYNPVVVREHGGNVTKLTPLASKPDSGFTDGTFYVEKATGTIYIYTRFFSTYTIAYTTAVSYTVSFNAQGGSSVEPIVVQEGGTISPLPTTTRGGYTFNGWYTNASGGAQLTASTAIRQDATYYAQWTKNSSGGGGGGGGTPVQKKYSVTVKDDGNGTGSASPASGISGTVVMLSASPAEGFRFKEWQVVSGGVSITGDSFTIGEENVVVRAIFEPDTAHTHIYTEVVTKEPTCTEKGVRTYSCECGDSYTEEIPALGHDYQDEITKEPTTTEEGVRTHTCIRCGHSYTEAIPKLSEDLLLYEKNEIRVIKKLKVGAGFTLAARFGSGKVVNERVVWASENPDVATVTQDGKVTALSGGETTITVRSEEDSELAAYCIVTVTEPVTEITLDKSKVSLGTGESVTLSAAVLPFTAEQSLDWTANNGKVKIEVSADGQSAVVTGVAAGNAKVTATAKDGSRKKAACTFAVGNPVPDFNISGKGNTSEVKAGKTLAMQVKWSGAKPKNANVSWSVRSADGGDASYIASISDKGVLTGLTAGKVTVTAVSEANPEKSASVTITVTAPAKGNGPEITEISFTNADKLKNTGLGTGKSYTIKTKLTLSGKGKASSDAVAWISSDSSVATVSQKGVVKAMAPGTATITAVARYAESISTAPQASVSFTMVSVVSSVKLDKKKLTIGTQEGAQYGRISIAKIAPADATDPSIAWTAENNNVSLAAVYEGASPASGTFAKAGVGVITKAGETLAVKALTPGVTKLTGITTDGTKKKIVCTVTVCGQVTGLAFKTAAAKNGVNNVTDQGDGKYSSNMKPGGSMTLSPVPEINGVKDTVSTKQIYAQYKKYTDTSVSYRSSDTSVLNVNKNGKISVKKDAGGKTATVYAASADGKQVAEIEITVK